MSRSREYNIWKSMRRRCEKNCRENIKEYYYGKGVRVCERWHNFENFYEDMGPRPSLKHTLDRVDNDGDYSPENCRWVTRKEQANNRSSNRIIEFNGKSQNLTQWAKELGVSDDVLRSRLGKLGWTLERALTEPLNV